MSSYIYTFGSDLLFALFCTVEKKKQTTKQPKQKIAAADPFILLFLGLYWWHTYSF